MDSIEGRKFFLSHYHSEKPYCSDFKNKKYGYRSRQTAIQKKFIEVGVKHYNNFIILDFDEAWVMNGRGGDTGTGYFGGRGLDELIEEDLMPMPNWVTTNPETKHVQLGYVIDGFVAKEVYKGYTYKADRTTVRVPGYAFGTTASDFFDDVWSGLNRTYKADNAYSRRIMRNPLHPDQVTEWMTDKVYKLKELKAYVTVKKVYHRKDGTPIQQQEPGRKVTLFEKTRAEAYKAVQGFKDEGDYMAWKVAVDAMARNWNSSFDVPLDDNQVQSVAKSVAGWTWNKYSGGNGGAALAEKQKKRAMIRWGDQRQRTTATIMDMVEAGFTIKEIAYNLGKSYDTAKKAIQRAKKDAADA